MSRRTRAAPGERPIVEARRGGPASADDDHLNAQIQAALRRGAETREARDRAHSVEADRANERESAALRSLIDGHRHDARGVTP
jgi:hypothetical protein